MTSVNNRKFEGQIYVASEPAEWVYNTTCIYSENRIAFDFKGVESGCNFQGHCIAELTSRNTYSGRASFSYEGSDPYECLVQFSVTPAERVIAISGSWIEGGETYLIEGDLEEV